MGYSSNSSNNGSGMGTGRETIVEIKKGGRYFLDDSETGKLYQVQQCPKGLRLVKPKPNR